jgi:hypothetical protein
MAKLGDLQVPAEEMDEDILSTDMLTAIKRSR